jgi:hypothetical protein
LDGSDDHCAQAAEARVRPKTNITTERNPNRMNSPHRLARKRSAEAED